MYKINDTLKTLFGKVKIDLIPNVSEFNTFISSYSEFAAIFGLKSPNRKDTLKQYEELRKANKYITKQSYRCMKYAAAGEMAKHDYLTNILLTKSDAYLVAGIHHKAGKPTKGGSQIWYQQAWSQVISLVNKTKRIAKGDCSLELKRVWIDKKPGDYARGLGVPKIHWRVHTFLENRIIEHTLVAKKLLTSWQHGGRAFKGTHTAWEKIMFVLRDKPFIFEFDIKGFYDNIITKNIAPFLGELMASRVQAIVDTTKPTEYKMPEADGDFAVLLNEGITNESREPYHLPNIVDKGYNRVIDSFDYIESQFDSGLTIEQIMSNFNKIQAIKEKEISQEQRYANYMEGNTSMDAHDYFNSDYFTESEREVGREKWKNLSQTGRGFPQGLSFSPILSTNALERALPGVTSANITMYMDDGLIYGNSEAEIAQIITKLESALSILGISLAPEKSGWVRKNWTFVKESKFLAIKILEDGSLVSQTRNGTSRPFPNPLPRDEYLEFCESLEIAPSTARITYDDILAKKGKEYVIWLGNVMGNILNYMYAPESARDNQEWKIMEGRMKAIQKILRNKHKTLHKLEKYFPEPITRPGLGEKLEAVRLTSVSSIACIRLLRYLREKRNRRVRA